MSECEALMVVVTSPDGIVQAAEVSLATASANGVENELVQARDANMMAMDAIVANHCSPAFAKVLSGNGYLMERVKDKLRDAGWRFETRSVSLGNGVKL